MKNYFVLSDEKIVGVIKANTLKSASEKLFFKWGNSAYFAELKTIRTISDDRAKKICTAWHGGQNSAFYQFTSSGFYLPNVLRYLQEVEFCLTSGERALYCFNLSQKDIRELKSLERYFIVKAAENKAFIEWVEHPVYSYRIPYLQEQVNDEITNKVTLLKYLA